MTTLRRIILLTVAALSMALRGEAFERFDSTMVAGHRSTAADMAQYVPLAFPWVMKAAGATTRSSWGRMAVSQALGTGLMAGSVYLTKHLVDARRPDGSDDRSFPSGHTAWAFMGATATAIELGYESPWYAVGAYTFATGVAVQRVIANRHFPADVVAGAGIGILAAELGYYLGDVIFGDKGLSRPASSLLSGDRDNPSYVSLTAGLLWPLGDISVEGGKIVRLPALNAGLKGGVSLGDHWGLSAAALLQSTPLQLDKPGLTVYVGRQNRIGLMAGGYYALPLSRRVTVTAEAMGGYFKNLNIGGSGGIVDDGWGTPAGRIDLGAIINLTDRLSCRASVGYQIEHYSYVIADTPGRARGTGSGITASLSTRVNL